MADRGVAFAHVPGSPKFMPSVAAAAAAAETAAAARGFLAEVDVIVERSIGRIGIELHLRACEHAAIPRIHTDSGAPRQHSRRQADSDDTFHCSSLPRSASYSDRFEFWKPRCRATRSPSRE